MANKYCNLDGTQKISVEYPKINLGFDNVDIDVSANKNDLVELDARVTTIITTPLDGLAATQEIVDARQGELSLGANLTGVKAQLADIGINSNTFPTMQEAVNYCQTNNKTLIITDNYTLTNESIKITAPLTVKWNNGKIIQSSWGYPAIEVRSVDVIFEGKCRVENTGIKSLITVPTVPETIGDPKASCSGILLIGQSHRFKAEYIYAKNFVGGLTLNDNIKDDIYIGRLEVENVDFGLFGSGFNNFRIDSIFGRNIVKTQGEPEHTVYITGSETHYRNKGLSIGDIQTDGLNSGTTTVSIKSTYDLYIGNITGRNILGGIFNAQWTKGTVKSIIANLTGILVDNAILTQNIDTNIRFDGIDIETDSPAVVINNTLSSTSILVKPRIKLTSANPNIAIRNTGLLCKVYEPSIEYVNSQGVNYAIYNENKMEVNNPELISASALLIKNNNAGGLAVCKAVLNPNLYPHVATSIYATDDVYNNSFVDYQINPLLLAEGDIQPSLRGANVIKSSNLTNKIITQFKRGTNNQKFMIINGGNTEIANNASIVLKGGVNILTANWVVLNFIYLNGIAYEV